MKAITVVLLPTLLVSCIGIDFITRTDTRRKLSECANQGSNDTAISRVARANCTALLREAQNIRGDVSVLFASPEMLLAEIQRRGISTEEFLNSDISRQYARAHIFPQSRLITGVNTSLNGRQVNVVCDPQLRNSVCEVEGARAETDPPPTTVYTGGKFYIFRGLLEF